MRKLIVKILIVFSIFVLVGCKKCEHEYDGGVITKEATCTEEGEKLYTCSLCKETKVESIGKKEHEYEEKVTKEPTFDEEGEKKFTCKYCEDSYVEVIPVRDDEVIVTVTNKVNLPQNANAGRYSDRVEFSFAITNNTEKSIKGIQGMVKISDLFEKQFLVIECDFTGNLIVPHGSISVDNLGIDINQFMDEHVKLYNTEFSDLKFEYEVTNIVYENELESRDSSATDKMENQKVVVVVKDKQNLDINYNVGRYSPRVEFSFEVYNNTPKDIRGVQGTLTIKDMFGVEFMLVELDFTGQTINANGSSVYTEMGLDVNQFMDEHVKLYNENFEDLQFEYEIISIVYVDGTQE